MIQLIYQFKSPTEKSVKDQINEEDTLVKIPVLEERKGLAHTLSLLKYSKNYDHIEIFKENDETIELLALHGNGRGWEDSGGEKYNDLDLYLVAINLKTFEIQEEKIFNLKENNRALDLLVDGQNIFISFVHVNKKNQGNVRVIRLNGDNKSKKYELIFETNKILAPFEIADSGGKLLKIKNNLLVSIGNFAKGGSAKDSSYLGKIMSINLSNGYGYKVISSGHRNIQGLYWSKTDKIIISTEHGPRGGDEINEIQEGKDYGWPKVSYGFPYYWETKHNNVWATNTINFGHHENFKKPIYAFVPSIGIKAIEQLPEQQFQFPQWKNNYLVCSAQGLFRVKIEIENGVPRVIFYEKISHACRDLKITNSGIIVTNDLTLIKKKPGSRG
ncbi:PQQ-dependent sugar dehydrogenase [Methylophilaceae bacterium]|nr:PQQ-dependent sugar dehydrogenase [Methylophilaceae bacterium]